MELQITRKMHMDDQAKYPHDVYFEQFATKQVIGIVRQFITTEAILASKDPHFNDIPLGNWDKLHAMIGNAVGRDLSESNITTYAADFVKTPGFGYYSKSDTVCVAKAAARVIKRRGEMWPNYTQHQTWYTKCKQGRVHFDADWSEVQPFACYVAGTATLSHKSLADCEAYFKAKGMTLDIGEW